jgi:hypothetical protein
VKLIAGVFDLARLRGAFSEQFAAWDLAVRESNRQGAKQARRQIQHVARQGLSVQPATSGGFYLFHDPKEKGLDGLSYIGIADSPRRPIGRRIEDRLKDDSGLDVDLDEVEDGVARLIISGRLLCALPVSGQNYIEKHMRVAALFRRSPAVILLGCDETRDAIRETEKVLIGSAASAGASLMNRTCIGYRGPAFGMALELAEAVITTAGQLGFPESGLKCWRDSLRQM